MLKTTTINIREAVEDDLLDCLMLFKQFHKESKLPYSWDAKKTQDIFLATLSMEDVNVLVAETDGEIVGYICCQVIEPLFSSEKVASEIAWFVNKEYRKTSAGFRLMSAYEEWAVGRGAKYIGMAYLEEIADLSKVYKKKGYVKAETHYMKEI
ncbi:GCN5-related N-acetyltransferase [Celeribacter phage P12053L]|uniref:GCN5-related N-acetyltransferase n=1 Tax=Celeribacter phage P12053L TaxID=1197951 RepID=I6R9K6_9CAUD|nr:acetyltransferase [Celeribacter phage P12053L]AFM54649.1 GCN5-related N-acetyltransferase [Celeribacter phage P12053L]